MVLIKRIDRYIFFELVGPFFFGMLGACVITSFGPMMRGIRLLTKGEIAPYVIFRWFIHRVPEDMQYIFPVAVLLATLLAFGRMSQTSEITALRAAGISLGRLLYPVAFFGVIVSIGVFLFLDRILPPSMLISQRIWEHDIRKKTTRRYKENILLRRRDGGLLYIGRYDLNTNTIERFVLREYVSPERYASLSHRERIATEVSAQKAVWGGKEDGKNVWRLEKVRIRHFDMGSEMSGRSSAGRSSAGRAVAGAVDDLHLPPDVKLFRLETLDKILEEGPEDFIKTRDPKPRELSFRQLLKEIRYLEERGLANTTPLKVELYLKTSFPFCILIFALLGSTMGLSSQRSSGSIGFGISLIITFLYYLTMSLSASFGKTGVIDPFLAAWLHNLIFLAAALYSVYRVQNR